MIDPPDPPPPMTFDETVMFYSELAFTIAAILAASWVLVQLGKAFARYLR